MKKRTVITTEKREVWIINDGKVRREIPDPDTDVSGYSESATLPNEADSDALPEEESKEGNE